MTQSDIIDMLKRALVDAHEALAWHDGLQFQPEGRTGETISNIIVAALNEEHHEHS